MDQDRPWREGLQKFFAWVEELRTLGHSEEEIKSFIRELERRAFEKETQFMLDGGLTKPEVKAIWRDLSHRLCVDEGE